VAESLLGVAVRSAEQLRERDNILRLSLADGRSVVLKRPRRARSALHTVSFTAEAAALSFLNCMPTPVAPRLLGADESVLIMEDLGAASSLAHSLLAGDRGRAAADLVAYARTLGTMHAWSFGRGQEFASCSPAGKVPQPHWVAAMAKGKDPFLGIAARLGVAGKEVESEIDSLLPLMRGPGDAYTGFVHSDACPDNTYIPPDGNCLIFDFETSGWGPVTLDFNYLLAPFPSCWCFAALPDVVAAPAIDAYREAMTSAGVTLGPSWDVAVAAALGGVIVARGPALAHALDEDRDWGTTTARPRVLTWLASFADAATRCGALPYLRSVATVMREHLSQQWPDAATPDYPALARPGAPLARIPSEWD
jgi:hypothetical protein